MNGLHDNGYEVNLQRALFDSFRSGLPAPLPSQSVSAAPAREFRISAARQQPIITRSSPSTFTPKPRSSLPGVGRKENLRREGIRPVPTSSTPSTPSDPPTPPPATSGRGGQQRGESGDKPKKRERRRPPRTADPAATTSFSSQPYPPPTAHPPATSPPPSMAGKCEGGRGEDPYAFAESNVPKRALNTGGRELAVPRGSGWTQRAGRGYFDFYSDSEIRIGSELKGFFLCTLDESPDVQVVKSGHFDIRASVTCERRGNSSSPQFLFIVIDYDKAQSTVSQPSFCSVTLDARDAMVRLERFRKGRQACSEEVRSRHLKSNAAVDVLVQVRGDVVTVSINGNAYIKQKKFPEIERENIYVPGRGPRDLCGHVGIAVHRSAATVCNFMVDGGSDVPMLPQVRDASSTTSSSMKGRGGGGGGGNNHVQTTGGVSDGGGGRRQQQNVAVNDRRRTRGRGTFSDGDPRYVDVIEGEILIDDPSTTWDDIAALKEAKRLLKEAVILPIVMPEYFTGIREPWKGVMLFGPPGTGKTMLAKAVASQAKTTFFSVTASTLLSRFVGDSEKLVKTLFKMARYYSPSTIFFDEIDALMGQRSDNEHDVSRRVKTELLTQMDGIPSSTKDDTSVMVLAATNRPWDLDDAFRRRLEKRIYIPLPESEARREMFQLYLNDVDMEEEGEEKVDMDELTHLTDGYSGADVFVVCKDAAMQPLRRMMAEGMEIDEIKEKFEAGGMKPPELKLKMSDMRESIQRCRPSVSNADIKRYEQWHDEFGSK